jgi:serine/threonine protein kinase
MTEETIFATALEKPADERAAYLAEACGNDEALRKRLETLLAASEKVGNFMANPAVASAVDPAATETLPASAGREAKATNSDEEPLTFLTPSKRPDSLGRLGHYEVLQVLGKGGFGIVFRAFDEMLQRVVALKVMAPQLAATSPARKRFLREARSSAQVRHENVVHVYEVAEQPLPYLAMEFIPGETLQQKLDRVGPLDVPEVLRIGRQIAEGLAAAHAMDLIHRDIKPGNVLLEGGHQKVKITDFGLARAADDASISQSGLIAGTPMYMAPEQAEGQTLDHRADLFTLGSVLYQMVSGRPPFRANSTVAVLKRVADDKPRPIREIIPETPQWLCDIIAKLHAKDPEERYQSAREVADVLADCEVQLKANSKLKDFSRIPQSKQPAAGKSGRWKWVAAAAVLLPVLGLAVAEATGVTHLLPRQEPTVAVAAKINPEAAPKSEPKAEPKTPPPADPVATFTAGDKPPAKDLFPGQALTWLMFDDPLALTDRTRGNVTHPNWQRKIENGLSVTTTNFEDIRNWPRPVPIWFPMPSGDMALAIRFRCENMNLHLPLRRWQEGVATKSLAFALNVDGSWSVTRQSMRPNPKGGWQIEPEVTLAASSGPAPTLANGTWITLAMRLGGRTGELWANGQQLARLIDWRPEPATGEFETKAPFDGYQPKSGHGRYEIAYIAAWELPAASAPPAVAPFTEADVKRIAALPAEQQVEEVRKELMRRNPGFDGKMDPQIEDGVVTEFRIVTDKVTDIAPIRVFNALRLLDCHGTWPNGLLADLTPLKGMNLAGLTVLNLAWTKVTDAGLANFKDCKALTGLHLSWTKVTDAGLANFKDCKALTQLALDRTKVSDAGLIHFKDCKALTALNLGGTKVTDAGLAHFKGMPLMSLRIDNTGISDLTPLQSMPLEEIRLTPKNISKGLDILRHMKSLKTIGIDENQSWPAAEFWERYGKGEFK